MKRLIGILGVWSFLFMSPALFAGEPSLPWGGEGYDPALKAYGKTSRFLARPHYADPSLFEIWVDARETVQQTGQLILLVPNQREIVSQSCRKAQLHVTAPWACSFFKADILTLGSERQGKIRAVDRSGRVLMEEEVDLGELVKFCQDLPSLVVNPGGD